MMLTRSGMAVTTLLLASFMIIVQSVATADECNKGRSSVPVPTVWNRMNGEIHVSWTSKSNDVYRVQYCCYKEKDIYAGCDSPCPKYKPVLDCSRNNAGNSVTDDVKHKCQFNSALYVSYKISLVDSICNITGQVVVKKPTLEGAHLTKVDHLNMTMKGKGVLLEWTSTEDEYPDLCYNVSCSYLDVNKKKKSTTDNTTKNTTIFLPLLKAHHGTKYSCCVKPQICYLPHLTPYTETTCNHGLTLNRTTSGSVSIGGINNSGIGLSYLTLIGLHLMCLYVCQS